MKNKRTVPQTTMTGIPILFVLICLSFTAALRAQPAQTVGLFTHKAGSVDNGYVLFAPLSYTETYLIDKCGKLVHSWPSEHLPTLEAYLLDDGSLLRPALASGVEKIDWNGNVVWHASIGGPMHTQHHDIQPLPNGNFLVLSTDFHDANETIAAGRDPSNQPTELNSEEITEYKPVGTDSAEVVWQWRTWDHLVQDFDPALPNYLPVAKHPELVNINYLGTGGGVEWLHINSVKYNAALDQVLLSCCNLCEVWIIDHGTTTAQAASHTGGRYGKGGDLLYRWGNPEAYKSGTSSDKLLFGQHDAEWIPAGQPHAGSIMVFNNGAGGAIPQHSSVDIISPPADSNGNYDASRLPFLPLSQTWQFTDSPPESFFCSNGGGAQMLHNGNVLVCNAYTGDLFEVDSLKSKVWEYVCPVGNMGPIDQQASSTANSVFRALFYPSNYPAFANRALTGGVPIETHPLQYDCTLNDDTSAVPPSLTVGLMTHEPESLDSGYVLFAPPNDSTYLINKCGKQVHVWPSTQPGNGFVHLLPNGNILRAGNYQTAAGTAGSGKTQIQNWNGNVSWSYAFKDATQLQHDDVCMLPNGNILCLVTELHSNVDAYIAGRDSTPTTEWFRSEEVIELKPLGGDSATVLWRWRVWDHLIQDVDPARPNYGVVAQHPELVNINYAPAVSLTDWLHVNSIAFNAELNLILLSVQNLGEVWMIDHSTTTQEAAKHIYGYHDRGGDLLYRWGNPAAYDRGLPIAQKLFSPCGAEWIPKGFPSEGKILVFNTGINRGDSLYSSVNIFAPALDSPGVHNTETRPLLPDTVEWNYESLRPTDFYSPHLSSAHMLSNGNVLICNGTAGTFYEVDRSGTISWNYVQPVNANGPVTQGSPPGDIGIAGCSYYPFSFPAFNGKTLAPGDPIELHPVDYTCNLNVISAVAEHRFAPINLELFVYPNPASDHLSISTSDFEGTVTLYNCLGEAVVHGTTFGVLNTAGLPDGAYTLVVRNAETSRSRIITVIH